MAYRVRRMGAGDLPAGLHLSTAAGWNQRIDDWEWLAMTAGDGAFVAESSEGVIGTAMGLDYGSFGWIAMMLVTPAHRSQGVGRSLLDAAVGAVPAANPIGLDATPAGRPLYESRGFAETCSLTRYGRPGAHHGPLISADADLRPLGEGDLDAVVAVDAQVFGAARRGALAWALAQAPQLCWVARDSTTTMGYCFGRRGRLFDHIGPVVASSTEIAMALIAYACASHDPSRTLIADVFDRHAGLREWMEGQAFTGQRPLHRMWRPSTNATRPETSVLPGLREYATLGPDLA
jgi:GNAT superfamily N-acetyltransferase